MESIEKALITTCIRVGVVSGILALLTILMVLGGIL